MSNASTGNTSSSLSSRCRFLTEMSSIMIKKKVKPVSELIRFTFNVQTPCFDAEKYRKLLPGGRHVECFDWGLNLSAEFITLQNVRHVLCIKTVLKIKMAAMKTSPGLVNFFIYNSTFGPKEGMVCCMILKEYDFL